MENNNSLDLPTRIQQACDVIRSKDERVPEVALVLGSGLSPFAQTLTRARSIPYSEIPHMPRVGVVGHSGTLVMGELAGATPVRVAALAGRVHLYEGYSPDEVTFAVRTLITLGAKIVVLTNAAGGISPTMRPGDLVAITDHINFQFRNPLVGPNHSSLGPRFPDMTHVYDPELRKLVHQAAARTGTSLRDGVYAAMMGPSYETPAEIRMLRVLGADLVGMSTVPEAIAARHMGASVLGISCVTNLAAGVSPTLLSHEEVEATARATRDRFAKLVEQTLALLPRNS